MSDTLARLDAVIEQIEKVDAIGTTAAAGEYVIPTRRGLLNQLPIAELRAIRADLETWIAEVRAADRSYAELYAQIEKEREAVRKVAEAMEQWRTNGASVDALAARLREAMK